MNKYVISGNYPAIKYNYSAKNKKLYIHIYLNIEEKTKDTKFWYCNYDKKTNKYVGDKRNSIKKRKTYKNLIKQGVKEYWSIKVKGNKYDFEKGVNFSTKVIIHEKDNKKEIYDSKQNFIKVDIGDRSKEGKSDGQYWHFAYANNEMQYDYSDSQFIIKMSTQQLTAKTVKVKKIKNIFKYNCPPCDTQEEYKSIAGHEIGHVLGLDDAYPENGISRSIENKEVGYQNAIMYSKQVKANVNDIEMIISAYNMSINGKNKNAWQCYKTYELNNESYKISDVIKSYKKK